jgi:hypothetical protein
VARDSLLPARSRAELIRALKRELAEVNEYDRAEALGPHPMVGRIDCELCGEGVCHYLHISDEEARQRGSW